MRHSVRTYAEAFLEASRPKAEKGATRNFLSLIRKNGDTARLPEILRQIERMLYTKEGITKVEVEATRDIRKEVERGLRAEFGKDADIRFSLRPELVGGAVLRVNDEVLIDASVKRQLDMMFRT